MTKKALKKAQTKMSNSYRYRFLVFVNFQSFINKCRRGFQQILRTDIETQLESPH